MLCTWEMGSEKKEGTMGCVICTFDKRCSTFHFHASTPLLTLRMLIFLRVDSSGREAPARLLFQRVSGLSVTYDYWDTLYQVACRWELFSVLFLKAA